nr:60S ribosomal protein L38 [Tanacetum cinerariifolium]
MAKQIHVIKDFFLIARRKDDRSVKIKMSKDIVKFKSELSRFRCSDCEEVLSDKDSGPRPVCGLRQHKEESINDYYVWFSKLINDMRNIKMTMPKLQLNSKFVNNMLPEWGRFVMAVKLNKGLRKSNYDQLFAYLKQHEAYAKENKMVLERLSQPTADPLALLSNVSNIQHGSPSSSTSSITPLPPPRANLTDDLIENLTNTLALLTQSYRTFLPQTNNQLRTSSYRRNQATGGNAAVYEEAQNRVGNVNQGQARPGQARTAQENGVALDAEQLLFLADNVFHAKDCDAFDSDVDEAGPSYDSDILSEVQDHDQYLDDTCAYQEEHVMHDSVQLDHVVDLHADYTSVGNMIPYDQIQASLQGKDNAIRQLKKQLSKLQVTSSDTERTVKVRTIDSQLTKVTDPVTNLQAQNDLFRAENEKVKQHYKELYDSIKITRA